MNTKICTKCKIEKPLEEFAKRGDKLQSICKSCHNFYSHNHYLNNKQKYLDKAKRSDKKRKEWFEEYKQSLKCEKCGDNRWYVLEFHHLDPTEKDFNVSNAITSYGREKLLSEVKKCMVLCANCHREVHYQERKDLS